VAAACQLSGCCGGDKRVKVGGVERQHIGRQLKAPKDRTSDLDLGFLQVLSGDLSSQAVKRLSGKGGAWQARYARKTGVQKGSQMALAGGRTGPLNSHGEHHLANSRTVARGFQTTSLINEFDQIQLFSDPYQGADVADQSRPTAQVAAKSATGAGSAEPNTACRANGRCLAGSHNDWEAIRYRRPPTWRSNMFITSSSHIPETFASETRA